MKLQEKTIQTNELLRADIRGDIEVTGTAPHGARLAYLDAEDEPTEYRVSVQRVQPGSTVDGAETADHVLIGGPTTVVTLTKTAGAPA
jgi:hypothetical protein